MHGFHPHTTACSDVMTAVVRGGRGKKPSISNCKTTLMSEMLQAITYWSDTIVSLSHNLIFADWLGEIHVVLHPHGESWGAQF